MTRLCAVGVALLMVAACSGPAAELEPTTTSTPATVPTQATTSTITSQSGPTPEIVATTHFGGGGFDYAAAVAIDPSGRYFVSVDYRSGDSNHGDVAVLSFAADGSLEWSRTWGGPLADMPLRNTASPDGAGGVYVAAAVDDPEVGGRDLALVRLDADGNAMWQRLTFGAEGDQRPHAVAAAGDGSVFVGGHDGVEGEDHHEDRGLVMRVDGDGRLIWMKGLGGSASAEVYSGAIDSQGDFVVAGTLTDAGELDAFVAKITADGEIAWQYRWGDAGPPERVWDVVIGDDDDVYVAGPVVGVGNGGDTTFVLKFGSDGEPLWARTWTMPDNEIWSHGGAYGSGTLVVAGFIRTYLVDGRREHDSGYLLAITPDGDLQWQVAIGSGAKESLEGLRFGPDGTLIAVGQGARRDMAVVSLVGDWVESDLDPVATDLDLVDLDLPFVAADLELRPGLGAVGGGDDADALIVRLSLPSGV